MGRSNFYFVLNKSGRSGFTLVEVLVALSLAGVVVAIAFLLLHTTNQVTVELRQPLGSAFDVLEAEVRKDVDHLLPRVELEDDVPLSLSEEEGLHLISLREDVNGIPHPYLIHYRKEGSDIYRIHEGGIPVQSSTNLVMQSVRTFIPRAFVDGEEILSWPEKEEDLLPERITLEIRRRSPDTTKTFSFDVPASFGIEGKEEE